MSINFNPNIASNNFLLSTIRLITINLNVGHKPNEKDEKEGVETNKGKDEFSNNLGVTRIWEKDGGDICLALTIQVVYLKKLYSRSKELFI